jgi:PhzF family phenazine biosynthesis protein
MERRGFLAGSLAVPALALGATGAPGRTAPMPGGAGGLDFRQVDVFGKAALKGNPLAVVLGADHLSDEQMGDFATWTNLSETTFLLRPDNPQADYRVRIFARRRELPFAGHPTLGTCHVWRQAGGRPRGDLIVQQGAGGLVRIRAEGEELAFAAPPLTRSGPVDAATIAQVAAGLGITPGQVLRAQWVGSGTPWIAVMLGSRDAVLAIQPDFARLGPLAVGVFARCDPARDRGESDFEVRAFAGLEDPVTGSLNAGLAIWLIGAGLAPARYLVSQGTALGREGRVHVRQEGKDIWIGGTVRTLIAGRLDL